MRALTFALPLLLIAAPAAAAPRTATILPPELNDPAMGEKMGRALSVLTRSLMDLRVGEVKAAIEGREATAAERNQTVGDLAGGPAERARIERTIAASGPAMQKGVQAMARALPAMIDAVEGMADEMDRATANIPQPGYPRR